MRALRPKRPVNRKRALTLTRWAGAAALRDYWAASLSEALPIHFECNV
jgi:hypothetical protein